MQGSEVCATSIAMIDLEEKRRSVLEAFLKDAPQDLRDRCRRWIAEKKDSEIEQIWSDLRKKPERRTHD
jgi:hypothetical protein